VTGVQAGAPTISGGAPAQPGGAPAQPGGASAQLGNAPAQPGDAPAQPGDAPAQPGDAPQPGGAPAQPGDAPQPGGAPAQPGGTISTAGRAPYEANTNLTQISDWLTKTIVGVGLVNWQQGLAWFEHTADTLGKGLQLGPSGSTVGGSIILFFGISGFLCGYNLTQLFLARALAHADTASDQPH
jgi:hypothetical protein